MKYLSLVIFLALTAGFGAWYVRSRMLADGRDDPTSLAEPSATAPDHPTWSDPEPLRGFATWEASRKLKVVSGLQDDPKLSPDVLVCLRRLIRDKTLRPVVRNNMANCLVNQEEQDPELYRLFVEMFDDRTEDPVWRDYCIQFLGCCLLFAADRQAVVAKLKQAVAEGGSIAGTALLQLVAHGAAGELELPADFHRQITERLWREDTPEATKGTILGLLGETGDVAHLPTIRRVLADPSSTTTLRGALGALAELGSAVDVPLVEPFLLHRDRAVVEAAQNAQFRLREKK